eukprot:7378545-Prymnesium_polylepis.1
MLATPAAATDARPRARNNSVRCAEPFGAVRLADRPSCRTALPPSTAEVPTELPLRCCCTTSAPRASDRAYPFARASSVLHRPSVESIPAAAAPSVL